MLITLTEILAEAEKGNYAVIAPDFTSIFVAMNMIEQAEESRAPLILSYTTAFKPIMAVRSYQKFIRLILDEIEAVDVKICLHLDHAVSLEEIQEAVDVGFNSVMIDASTEPWEVNIERTIKASEIARAAGVSVEAELGLVTTGEGYYRKDNVDELLTNPELAEEFVFLTGIDALAISIGNVHGAYEGEPNIDFKRLIEINRRVSIPLVLHGTSGIGAKNLARSIQHGIRKINLYSEIVRSMHQSICASIEKDVMDPLGMHLSQEQAVKQVMASYIKLSGSEGKGYAGSEEAV
jgi:fructose-bisphosphate aldolase class II